MISILRIVLSVVFVTEVTSWTVDLSEVDKFDSEENGENEVLYNYAESFGYQTFKEREVNTTRILSNGSAYLEGLSRALMEFRDTLAKCVIGNGTESENESSSSSEDSAICGTARKNQEHVQKLSDLALITTNKLRDKAYNSNKTENITDEKEMLLQLAWFLDRLALVTGFEPNPKQYVRPDIEITTKIDDITTEKDDNLELMEQVESNGLLSKLPPKRLTAVKSVRKRSVENPLEEVFKYYVKYKIWNGDNFVNTDKKENNNFDTENNLKIKSVSKREIKKDIHIGKVIAIDNKRKILKRIKIVKSGNDLKFKSKVKVIKRPSMNYKHTAVFL